MSNDEADKIRQLEEQLEAAKAQARVQALEQELANLKNDQEAAEAAAAKAAEEKATADRAASLEAELAAIRSQQADTAAPPVSPESVAATPVVAAPAPAVAAAPTPPPAAPQAQPAAPLAEPAVIIPAPPQKAKKGGLVATLIILLLLLAAALVTLFLALRGDLRLPGSEDAAVLTDVVLIDAGSFGPAPAKTDSPELVTFDALSKPATGTAPEAGTAVSITEVAGDTAEIYGLSYASCQTIDETEPENAGAVAAYLAALNADETLGLGRALVAADVAAYYQQFTFGHLLADTRVTYNGYSAGANFPMQAVLQKGTLVAYDRYGVPRVHCGSGVALTQPVLATGETRFTGSAWADLDTSNLVVVTPASSPQSAFTVLPVGPSNVQTSFLNGPRQCAWNAAGSCPAPSDLTLASYPGDSATAGPSPTSATCSVWAPGTTDADAVSSRFVNATTKTLQAFMVDSAQAGCSMRFDMVISPGENRNVSNYWPGTILLFTDGTTATIEGEYTFGEQTLVVFQ